MSHAIQQNIKWPENKDFAFTIFDDTDWATLANVSPVYNFFLDKGFRTTKSVWVFKGDKNPVNEGQTCDDKQYLDWILDLQKNGFEVALHNVTSHTSIRSQTIKGIERFKQLFGHYPMSFANHTGCYENMYWGDSRLSGLRKQIYNAVLSYKYSNIYKGHDEESELFWGDICQRRIRYVRNFVFGNINTLKSCPIMPYHDPVRPYVNHWFAASQGASYDSFVKTISEQNLDKLCSENGACIMYTHLAANFTDRGKVRTEFKRLMKKLGNMNGWFVPVSELLDYLRSYGGEQQLIRKKRQSLEWRWLLYKMFILRRTT